MDTAVSVELFVEILNRYVYYFDQENDAVSWSRRTLTISILTRKSGDDQISERTDRIDSLEPQHE